MAESRKLTKSEIEELQRARFAEQIRKSKETIQHSQELIKRIDALLAQSEPKP